jgi:transcriptional regulator with PAS, ATPase and Fis domain
LNVIAISLPPLRAREGDIRLLAEYFVDRISRKVGKEIEKVDPKVLQRFENYHWPGNVRELLNAIEHAVNFLSKKEIRENHLPAYLRKKEEKIKEQQPGAERIKSLAAIEKEAIENALRFYNGNITRASKALGIGRNTLYEKIKRYSIE